MSFPPVYGGPFSVSPSVASLPAYTAHERPRTAGAVRQLTEHLFEIKDKKKKAWATLKLTSHARSTTSLPTFLEGDKITGSVTLNLTNSEKILGVSILIRGSMIAGPNPHDRLCFLDKTTPLWLKGMPNPEDSILPDGRLSGDYHWQFSVALPKEVALPDPEGKHGAYKTYHLPQTFLERSTRASVCYELFVHIERSVFRVDNKLQTMFVYVPAIRPDPPSQSRQLAYRQNGPILGPDADPEGWLSLPMVSITGTVFNTRRVNIKCQLSLAKPLSYTRGSVIPCSLTYACDDPQALELVCTPATTNVCLQRQVDFSPAPAAAEYALRDSTSHSLLEISRAVWWPVHDGRGLGSCRLDGEIHLPKSLKPSSTISHFRISYHVTLLPFEVTGFAMQAAKPALKQEVQIATMFPKGPKPRMYTPPCYESDVGDSMLIPPARAYI
ncbi:hypothetical protein B0H15DRAFT_862630 [Mycena belliarum]|uniref:Arrestin-like N-terminal domain-containing protein n=1 Tax=Mycena belliarum TaxID=1033014 RepID=A0AAD6TWX8_9AGAR|nr:hypothetical protein B0H15DRAFT_862630 [Mycena belliae]